MNMNEDKLESRDRASGAGNDPILKKYKVKDVPSTYQQSALLKSNYEKASTFLKVVLVVLVAAILLIYIINKPASIETHEYHQITEKTIIEEEIPTPQETTHETYISHEEIPPMKKDSKNENYVHHFKWLTLDKLREQSDLDSFLLEKIHKEFQPFNFEMEIYQTREKYMGILNISDGYQFGLMNSEELEKKIDHFLTLKKNLTLSYEKGFNLTNEILKAVQEYSICKTEVFSDKDRLANISIEDEKSKMLIKRYQGEIEEMDRLLNSQLSDTQTLLSKYEAEKRKLLALLADKQKELHRLKQDPDRLLRDLDEIRRALSEFNNKDKLFVEVRDNSDEIERIKKRMREIEAERDHILAHLDFLNKKLKSYDNIAKVGENFKSFSSNDAPKILLEKLKNMQKEYQERPQNRKYLKTRIEDTKKEYIDSMHASINGKRHLANIEDSSRVSGNAEKRENYQKELKSLEKEFEDLAKRLAYLEKNVEKNKKIYSDWDKKHEEMKRKEMDKDSMLVEFTSKIHHLEREIEDINLQLQDKERMIEQIKSQPKFDPAIVNANKRELEEKIRVLKRIMNQIENEYFATLKKINNEIKECRIKYAYVHDLMKRNKIMDDFKEILENLLTLKEDLRRKMRNYVEAI